MRRDLSRLKLYSLEFRRVRRDHIDIYKSLTELNRISSERMFLNGGRIQN